MKKLYDPETGKFDPTPIEDFCMWTALKRGGDCEAVALVLSGKLDELEADDDL